MFFKSLNVDHIALLISWLQRPHITPFWQETNNLAELEEKFLIKLPHQSVYAFIIEHNNKPIGYIQYYEATKVGEGWWPDEKPNNYGIDLMIGEEKYLNKGLGPQIIKEFIEFLKSRHTNVDSIIIDPEPTNTRAIRAFEKAGFQKEKLMQTPNGEALLMRMNLK